MKYTFLLIPFLCLSLFIQAQVIKTVNISAGGLSSFVNKEGKYDITHLTVIGTIDARDFETMRDSLPSLIAVDLRNAHIVSFTAKGGKIVVMAQDLNTGEVKISVRHGSGEDYINKSDEVPSVAFCGKSDLSSIVIPSTASAINDNAFWACRGLNTITIPEGVIQIESGAFRECSSLKTLIVKSKSPVELSDKTEVFKGINKNTCTLFVPVGSKGKYEVATGWKEFKKIVETK